MVDFSCWCLISDKKSAVSQPKKKSSGRRHKAPLSNGKVANGVAHLTNGSHSRAEDSQEPLPNGHHAGEERRGFDHFVSLHPQPSAHVSPRRVIR